MRALIWILTTLAAGAAGGCTEDAAEPDCDRSGNACTYAGKPGQVGFNGDGHDRLDTELYWAMDLSFAADGTVWLIDWNNHLVRRVRRDQTVETMVGWIDPVFPGDGLPGRAEQSLEGAYGTDVQLNHPTDLVQAADGKVLVMAWHNHKLREVDPQTKRVRILAGAGPGYAGDGMTMAAAAFKQPKGLEQDAAGDLYVLDQQNFRIRKITRSTGAMSLVAGNGQQGSEGDGGPALAARFNFEAGSNPESSPTPSATRCAPSISPPGSSTRSSAPAWRATPAMGARRGRRSSRRRAIWRSGRRGTSTSPTPTTARSAPSISRRGSSAPSPAPASSATRPTRASLRPASSWRGRSGSSSTPAATCSSATPSTAGS
jgi:hypothetical protein